MELGHPQVALTNALVDALGHRLPDIVCEWQTPMDRRAGKVPETKTRRPDMRDIEVRMFPETWPSTALGFGGVGGAAMTQPTPSSCSASAPPPSTGVAILPTRLSRPKHS